MQSVLRTTRLLTTKSLLGIARSRTDCIMSVWPAQQRGTETTLRIKTNEFLSDRPVIFFSPRISWEIHPFEHPVTYSVPSIPEVPYYVFITFE